MELQAGAAIDQLMATYHTTLSGRPIGASPRRSDAARGQTNDFYRARDGRWISSSPPIRICGTAVCSVLGCGFDKVGIAQATADRDAFTLEEAICARVASPASCAPATSGSRTPPGGTWPGVGRRDRTRR
ncbi:hypothetical protein GCM10020221_14660 [Streptomyces thioluteus]|uniref:Uncharacterized protein n=1 Tax=Streptomyces thioluteus TaxID=66431 RepID=A0ABP6J3W5_STRTU